MRISSVGCLQRGNMLIQQNHQSERTTRLQQARDGTMFTMAAAGTAEELGPALFEAAKAGNAAEVARLLDRGADMEAKNKVSRPLPSSPSCLGEPSVSAGLTATRLVHIRGVAPWWLERGALQRVRVRRSGERAVVDGWAWVG